MEKITDNAIYFLGGELSNKHIASFTHKGETFAHAEQAFMWAKAKYFDDEQSASMILKRTNPKVIYDLGKSIENFSEGIWKAVRLKIMEEILLSKFTSSDKLQELLGNTENKRLVYGDPYNVVWGAGLHWKDSLIFNPKEWKGENLLGIALENVRNEITGSLVDEDEWKASSDDRTMYDMGTFGVMDERVAMLTDPYTKKPKKTQGFLGKIARLVRGEDFGPK